MNFLKKETKFLEWNDFVEYNHWQAKQDYYGKAIHISRNVLLGIIIIFCIITPGTNWIIPLAPKTIKKGFTLRWD